MAGVVYGYIIDNQQNSYHPKIVLSFSLSRLPVLDGVDWAVVVASHAHRAVAIPLRMAVLQSDVLQGAYLHAFAAADAFFGEAVLAVIGGVFVEALVDQMAFQPSEAAHGHLRELFVVDQSWDVSHDRGFCRFNFLLGPFFRVELEAWHANVSLGHL